MDELILAGHSFGGGTVIFTACELESGVKAVLAMDPWLWTKSEEILEGAYKLSCPIIVSNTIPFHAFNKQHFDSWACTKTIVAGSQK